MADPNYTPGPGSPPGDLHGVMPQTDNDKLLGALCYIFLLLVSVIILVTDMKDSRFAKVHAYQGLVFAGFSIAFYIAYGLIWAILSAFIPFIGCVLWVGFFLPFVLGVYFAYKVFTQGQVVFPYLTDLTRQAFKDL